ncbi:MAG: FKBP-type peptidyl-prolyl cis-trans isomerase [Muribaculaceae bacterium]|nr:FKBP-type peptidyl-prolyl cis-trans isomerase [Muribaculaceae bacterium]
MANNQIVGPGKFVAYAYKVYNDKTGELLFATPEDAPDVMVYGVSNDVVPGLVEAMKGLKEGDKFSVTLPPQVAFGERYEDNVIELEKEIFMRDGALVAEVTVGAELPMMTQEGFMVKGRVLEITPTHVKMDFNHPFAGLTVRFDGEIDTVRDATPEELNPPRHCGCGCGHDHCGDHNHDRCGCDDDHCDCNDEHDCGCGGHGHHHDNECGCGHKH